MKRLGARKGVSRIFSSIQGYLLWEEVVALKRTDVVLLLTLALTGLPAWLSAAPPGLHLPLRTLRGLLALSLQ